MMQGWRTNQEDAHSVRMSFLEKYSLFAVYDGHGGEEVSKWSETTLPNAIQTNLKQHKSNLQSFGENMKEIFIEHGQFFTILKLIKINFKYLQTKLIKNKNFISTNLGSFCGRSYLSHQKYLFNSIKHTFLVIIF